MGFAKIKNDYPEQLLFGSNTEPPSSPRNVRMTIFESLKINYINVIIDSPS